MRKYVSIALVLLAVSTLFSCGEKAPEGEFIVKGKLTDVPDSTIVTLYRTEGNIGTSVAFDTLINGEFYFHDTITTAPRKFDISLSGAANSFARRDFFVAPRSITNITGSDVNMMFWNFDNDLKEQQEFDKYHAVRMPEYGDSFTVYGEMIDLWEQPRTDETKLKLDSLGSLRMSLYSAAGLKHLEYMKVAPVSEIWLDEYHSLVQLLQYEPNSPNVPAIKALYERMTEADKLTSVGVKITEYMNLPVPVKVGDAMVDGVLYDTLGKKRSLSEFKGDYILLDFFSQWCGPCLSSIPELEELKKTYADKLSVVAISEDPIDKWKSFIERKNLKGNQFNELRGARTGLWAHYGVSGIPHYVLIAPDGMVQSIWTGYGPGSLKQKLAEELK